MSEPLRALAGLPGIDVAAAWPTTTVRIVVVAAVLALALGIATLALAALTDRVPRPGANGRRPVRSAERPPEPRPRAHVPQPTPLPDAAPELGAREPPARRVVDDLIRVLDADTRRGGGDDDTVIMTPSRPREAPDRIERPPVARRPAPVEPVAPPARAAPAKPSSGPECDIRWWRGYVYSKFYAFARGADGDEHVLAESPDFRWRKAEPPPQEGEPLDSHRTLVGALERDGWTVVGRGEHWFSLRLRPRRGRMRAPTRESRGG